MSPAAVRLSPCGGRGRRRDSWAVGRAGPKLHGGTGPKLHGAGPKLHGGSRLLPEVSDTCRKPPCSSLGAAVQQPGSSLKRYLSSLGALELRSQDLSSEEFSVCWIDLVLWCDFATSDKTRSQCLHHSWLELVMLLRELVQTCLQWLGWSWNDLICSDKFASVGSTSSCVQISPFQSEHACSACIACISSSHFAICAKCFCNVWIDLVSVFEFLEISSYTFVELA